MPRIMSVAVTPDSLQPEPNTRLKLAGSLLHSLQSDRQTDVAFNMVGKTIILSQERVFHVL